jgi:predicted outer membrane protein
MNMIGQGKHSSARQRGAGAAWIVLVGILPLALGACAASPQAASRPATTQTAIEKAQLRQALAEMAKNEQDKTQLAWYATSFLRKVNPPVEDFAKQMGTSQAELLKELQRLARARGISLEFDFPPTIDGRARALLEKAQGDEVQNASREDFQRDLVYLMYLAYKDQLYLAKAVQERVHDDPELEAYLRKVVIVHEAGIVQLRGLLQRYKFQ